MEISTFIIGAVSPLGATLLHHLVKTTSEPILILDESSKVAALRDLVHHYGSERVEMAFSDPLSGFESLRPELQEALRHNVRFIYNLAFDCDRRRSASALHRANDSAVRFALSLASMAEHLLALVSVTDVGLAGDYPGRFYESWMDVSQRSLDAVDASSLEAEKALVASGLPVIRARIGLLSDPDPDLFDAADWPSAARVLVPTLPLLRRLPRVLSIPTIVDEGSLAPLSPLPWTAQALAVLAGDGEAVGKAVHMVLGEPVPMTSLLYELHQVVGGARVKGGLPVHLLDSLAEMPGISEALRRRFDQLSSLWTPHRYCLSRNDLDTTVAQSLLGKTLPQPRWDDARLLFFRHRG
ncbi:MAG: hypothetical protein MUC50_09290 [Myxococcota bacterium]|jgi:hypothetical protein|nr:hypothetical protein [Myxococcota bacterium]